MTYDAKLKLHEANQIQEEIDKQKIERAKKLLETATKHDQGKPMMSLVPPAGTMEVAKVMTFGAGKYGAKNWENGLSEQRLFDACLRHINADLQGEKLDSESGLLHIAHAASNLLMLIDTRLKGYNK